MRIERRLRCHSPAVWRVLLEAKMTTVLAIIRHVVEKASVQVGLVQNDDVVQDLPSATENPALRERILTGLWLDKTASALGIKAFF